MSIQERNVTRRAVVIGGGAVGVAGLVAACGGGGSESTSTSPAPTQSPTQSPTGPAPTSASPTGSPDAPTGTRVASVGDVPVEGGVIVDDPAVVVTQPADGEIKAFTSICPHQGCPVSEVVANEIRCPCHGSLFSAVDGSVIQGPAIEALAAAPVTVADGEIYIG